MSFPRDSSLKSVWSQTRLSVWFVQRIIVSDHRLVRSLSQISSFVSVSPVISVVRVPVTVVSTVQVRCCLLLNLRSNKGSTVVEVLNVIISTLFNKGVPTVDVLSPVLTDVVTSRSDTGEVGRRSRNSRQWVRVRPRGQVSRPWVPQTYSQVRSSGVYRSRRWRPPVLLEEVGRGMEVFSSSWSHVTKSTYGLTVHFPIVVRKIRLEVILVS